MTRRPAALVAVLAFASACGDGQSRRGTRPGPVSSDGGVAGQAAAEGARQRRTDGRVAIERFRDGDGPSGNGGRGGASGATPEALAGAGVGSDARAGSGGAGGEVPGPARGRVVDFTTSRPLAGRRVVIGASLSEGTAQVVETDATGYFSFEASGAYQVLIIDPDGSTVSFYERLETREPVLIHHPTPEWQPPTRVASLQGNLSGGASYPLTGKNDMVVVHLLSAEVTTYDSIGGDLAPHGPEYNLLPGFESESLPAALLALGIFRDPLDDRRYSAALALKELTLVEGENAPRDLSLTPVALVRITGGIRVPAGWVFEQTSEYYRLPVPSSAVGFPYAPVARIYPDANGGAFDYEVPNLSSYGGQLCVSAMAKLVPAGDASEGWLWTESCRIDFDGAAVDIDFEEAPALVEPAPNTRFSKGTRFVWSRPGSPSAPNLLELYPGSADPQSPGLSIFTTGDSATLPDLEAWGVKLPASAAYSAIPVALWSDAADAFAPDGFGATIPGERRTSYAFETLLVVGP